MANNLIVDSHQHFWQVGRFDYPWMSPELGVLFRDFLPAAIEPELKRCGIDQTVLVQASNSLDETGWLLALAERHRFIGGVVGWVDLTSDDIEQQLGQFVSHAKFKGVRHLIESEPADDWVTQSNVVGGLRALAAKDLSYDLLVHTRHLRHATRVAERVPELRFVVDHLAKPPIATREIDGWADEFRKLAEFPNVSCKLSGLVTEADHSWRNEDLKPYVEIALECFGPERMMFGSDWPVCLLAASYDEVFDSTQSLLADLNHEERERIFAKNAIDFYRLQLTRDA
jgi:L-fuconolactonase